MIGHDSHDDEEISLQRASAEFDIPVMKLRWAIWSKRLPTKDDRRPYWVRRGDVKQFLRGSADGTEDQAERA